MINVAGRILLLLALASLLGCAGTQGYSSMSSGERLFRANCRSCHILPKPAKYNDAAWDSLVTRYGDRINLSNADRFEILEYLHSANGD